MQPSRTSLFKTIHYTVTCKAQYNIILAEVRYVHEGILLHCLKYVGCWHSPLCIHSHFFLVFSTFSFIHLHIKWKTWSSINVYVQISLKSQVAVWLCLPCIKSTVSCFFNYQLSGSCGTPRSLSNGERSYSSTTVRSTVTYTCNTGYLRTAGSSSRTCQSDGQWSGSHPTCTRKSMHTMLF